ncbi:DnaJ/Hsp40 cysteine-rich domain superfamily protein [Actinidia rufa]|uniref:DnaJ/Hsp40 cysteine-rich domain superfamily protein n=1 Tax=Actinidia rufa TaxID=165716 RepID=A0A7J0FF44_9ERIC|nr:DnaJ/Hsp40 cysteine-rich domain superfamily protein [Actinidia rufa]
MVPGGCWWDGSENGFHMQSGEEMREVEGVFSSIQSARQSDAYLLVVHSLCGVDHESVENSNVSQLWGISARVRWTGLWSPLQPKPIACSSCNSNGHVECKWCRGTGFFILGDNMLCQVPSRNTSCVICAGKGSTYCADCKGTGFRAKWLEEPPSISK